MKKIKNILLTAVIALSSLSFTFAQGKVAHVNSNEIVPLLPEAIDARGEAEKLENTYKSDLEDLIGVIQAKVQQYEAEAVNQTPDENRKRQQELAELEQSYQAYQQQAQRDMQQKSMEWMKPINEKFMKAIDEVCEELGLDYVFDIGGNGNRGLLIRFNGKDITPEVKAKLGV